jgi:hypothetical protein
MDEITNYTVVLGNFEITNCKAVLIVDGIEIFRLRERAGDGQLVADFEIRNQNNKLLFKFAKNNVVHAKKGYKIINKPYSSEVINEVTGRIKAKAEEIAPCKIRITGTFNINNFNIVMTDDFLEINTNRFYGGGVVGCGKGIVLGNEGIGVASS